jgi:hypothetical protein
MLTLPASSNAVRLRTWRGLKALGCGALRDGVYVLPNSRRDAFERVAAEVREHGGSAWIFEAAAHAPTQQDELLALFDRAQDYSAWHAQLQSLREALDSRVETECRRRFRSLTEALEAIELIDYFPDGARDQARADLEALRHGIDEKFAGGEPLSKAGAVPTLRRENFLGKRWATRARPWVDRLACCWLIRRFIDPQAQFVWLRDVAKLPRGAVGFDFDGARFTHVEGRVSFEVLSASFGLDADPRLSRIGSIVHYLDVGGIPLPEAAGLESILAGLRDLQPDDDQLMLAAGLVFEALYTAATGEKK